MKKMLDPIKRIPKVCAKCGKSDFELTEDGLECIHDGWNYYLSPEQIARIKALDKTKCGHQNKN